MFSQKMKRIIAAILVVCMTFCSQGFSVLASSISDVVEESVVKEQEKETPNYYLEYEHYEKEEIIYTEVKNSDDDLVELEEESTEEIIDEADVVEPEEDETEVETEDETEVETEVENETEVETKESVEETEVEETSETVEVETSEKIVETETTTIVETEETTVETNENETIENINEKVEEEDATVSDAAEEVVDTKDETDELDEIDDVKSTESDIDFSDATESEVEKEVVVIKKYIVATRSIPEDSIWSLKKILVNDANGSFVSLPNAEVIKDKYLADTVKVLLTNQYGDEKVVEVPADWNVKFISKIYEPEGYVAEDKEYKANEDGTVEVKDVVTGEVIVEDNVTEDKKEETILETTDVNDETYVDETAETYVEEKEVVAQEVETETELVPAAEIEEIEAEIAEPEVAGFADTEEETKEEKVKEVTDEVNDKEYDAEVGESDKEIVYEYEEIEGNGPIKVDEDELTNGDGVVGNAKTDVADKEKAAEEAVATLDLSKLLAALSQTLGSEVSAKEEDNVVLSLFGAGPAHVNHWACGRANCSDTMRNHFNENMNTDHPENGVITYTRIDNYTDFKNYINNGGADVAGYANKDYFYLDADIEITEHIVVTRPLYICLYGYTLKFSADGQLDTQYVLTNATIRQKTTGLNPYAICFCDCGNNTSSTNANHMGIIDGQNIGRNKPAIMYTKAKGVYFYGLGNEGTVNANTNYVENEKRITIKGFKLDTSVAANKKYQPITVKDDKVPGATSVTQEPIAGSTDITSSFLCMSINSAPQAETQIARQAFFYAVDVQGCTSNDGGFAYLSYINSFAVEHSKFTNVYAYRGGIFSVDFNNKKYNNKGTKIENDYINIGHSKFTGSGYLNYTVDNNVEDTGDWDYNIGNNANTKINVNANKNGLILIENYDGGAHDQSYRIIKGNEYSNNDLRANSTTSAGPVDATKTKGYVLYITYDTTGNNVITISDNTIQGNTGGALFFTNDYKSKHVPVAEQASYTSNGIIYFDRNTVSGNKINTDYNDAGLLEFDDLRTVLINTLDDTQSVISNNQLSNTGAVKCVDVQSINIYSTKFDQNYSLSSAQGVTDGVGTYLKRCETVNIGHKTLFTGQVEYIGKTGEKAKNGGAIYAADVEDLSISGVNIVGASAINGGAVYLAGTYSDVSLNIYGTTFKHNKADENGGAVYYKGAEDHKNTIDISYYLNHDNRTVFTTDSGYNSAGLEGDAMYLENVNGGGRMQYITIDGTHDGGVSTSTYDNSTIAIKKSDNIKFGLSEIKNIVPTGTDVTKHFSTINLDNATLLLDKGFDIHDSMNPFKLQGATLSMVDYNFSPHSNVATENEILITKNIGAYVIGCTSDRESNVYFKQGKIIENRLDVGTNGTNRPQRDPSSSNMSSYTYVVNDISYDGMLGYIYKSTNEGDFKQSNFYFGGNIRIGGTDKEADTIENTRGSDKANFPIEAVNTDKGEDYNQLKVRHFNATIVPLAADAFRSGTKETKLKDGVKDTRLGANAHITFTPINTFFHTAAGGAVIASESQVLKMYDDAKTGRFNNWFIQSYNDGEGGAVPTSAFSNDLYLKPIVIVSPVIDSRVVYYEQGTKPDGGELRDEGNIYLTDGSELITFKFNMLMPTKPEDPGYSDEHVQPIADQRIKKGKNILRPVKDISIASDSDAFIYTQLGSGKQGKLRVFDVIGDIGFDHIDPDKRFHSWEFGAGKQVTIDGSFVNPELYVIYARIDHAHKVCGIENGSTCDHLGQEEDPHHAEFGGEENEFDKSMVVIDVQYPQQLMYALEHPEYMYVLSKDIEIGAEVEGLRTDDVLNRLSHPIKGLKLCLNGHKISVVKNISLFALEGDCYITDCTKTAAQKSKATIQFSATVSNVTNPLFIYKDDMGSGASRISTPSSLNIYSVNGDASEQCIQFTNLPTNCGDPFVKGLGLGDEVHMERVRFKSNTLSSGILKTKGTTCLDECEFDGNIIQGTSTEGYSLIDMRDYAGSDETYDRKKASFYVREGVYSNNKIKVVNSSIIKVASVHEQSSVVFQRNDSGGVTPGVMIENNAVGNQAAVMLTGDGTNIMKASVQIENVTFNHNYVDATEKPAVSGNIYNGGGLNLTNVAGKEVAMANCIFTDNGLDIKGTNNYGLINEGFTVNGGGLYIEGSDAYLLNNTLEITKTTFKGNSATNGGHMYLKNSRAITYTGDMERYEDTKESFVGGFAKEGSLLYYTSNDTSVANTGKLSILNSQIKENGYSGAAATVKSGSMVYYEARTDKTASLEFNFVNVVNNFASDGLFKIGDVYNSEGLTNYLAIIDEKSQIIHNGMDASGNLIYGGPIFNFVNSSSYKSELQLTPRENTKLVIEENYVGENRKAIENKYTASASIVFGGDLTIKNNFTKESGVYYQANVRAYKSLGMSTEMSTYKFNGASVYIYFNTDKEDEVPITKWNAETVSRYAANYAQEHYISDTDMRLPDYTFTSGTTYKNK